MIIRLAIKVRVAGINFGFLFRHIAWGVETRGESFSGFMRTKNHRLVVIKLLGAFLALIEIRVIRQT